MPDDFTGIYQDIHKEILAGLKNERERLDDAKQNLEFYRGDFHSAPPRDSSSQYDANRFQRASLLMQRIVKTLTANLYNHGPARVLKPPQGDTNPAYEAATEWLSNCYRVNCVDALWQEADRLSMAADFAAFQVVGTKDPKRSVRISLWRADELCVWVDPDDQLVPIAVVTLDLYDHRRRARLWTPEFMTTYLTDKWEASKTAGATAYKLQERQPNPYGVLPFSFVHCEFPTCEFYNAGPGNYLRAVNDGMNFGLTEGFDCIRYNLRPVVVLKNVRSGWRPPSPIKPGDMWDLPGNGDGSEGDPKQSADYLQADSSFVAASWDDLQNYLDHVLEMLGVPPSTIRMEQTASLSGVAIVAEQIPLILWAESRQRPFSYYEDDLARLVLRIGAKHLGRQPEGEEYAQYRATAAQLEEVADEPGLVLRWANMYPKLPGPERDQADQWLLDNHLSSRTLLLMERDKLTREEAEARLEEVAEDLMREQKLFEPLAVDAMAGQQTPQAEGGDAVVADDLNDDEYEETDGE